MLELKYHVQLIARAGRVLFRFVDRDAGSLTDRHDVMLAKHTAVHLLQVLVDTRAVADIRRQVPVKAIRYLAVREGLDLRDHADDIHAETVDTLLSAPPVHHVEDLIADFRVLPVQIRLLL